MSISSTQLDDDHQTSHPFLKLKDRYHTADDTYRFVPTPQQSATGASMPGEGTVCSQKRHGRQEAFSHLCMRRNTVIALNREPYEISLHSSCPVFELRTPGLIGCPCTRIERAAARQHGRHAAGGAARGEAGGEAGDRHRRPRPEGFPTQCSLSPPTPYPTSGPSPRRGRRLGRPAPLGPLASCDGVPVLRSRTRGGEGIRELTAVPPPPPLHP